MHSICQQIWKSSQWPQDWERSVSFPTSKKGNTKEYSDYRTIVLIAHVIKVMLKMLWARLHHYVNQELPNVQTEKQSNQRSNCKHSLHNKARELQKNTYFCFIECTKAFYHVDCNKLWKILKEMGKLDHLTCLLRNLNASQEATVITVYGTDWFKIGEEVWQGSTLLPC